MSNFSEKQIQDVWEKAKIVNGWDKDKHRKDYAGAIIQRDMYGDVQSNESELSYKWEIDHQKPQSKGGSDDISNLQPLQWKNNREKDNNYPDWSTAVSSEGDKKVLKKQNWKV